MLACALWNSTTYSPYTKLYTLPQPSEVGTEKKVKLVFSKLILLLLRKHTMAGISKYCRKITSPFLASNVVCMSSGDLLIWRNFEFWSTNICYCLLSAEKKRVWLGNIFCWTNKRSIFSVKKKENKYSYFKIGNFVKFANHWMTYQKH